MRLILNDQGGNQHIFIYHFVDLKLGVEIFFEKKSGGNRNRCHWVWNWSNSALLYWGLKKILCRVYVGFLVTKKLLKALLTCSFIPWLLNSFDLPSYSSESMKRFSLILFFLIGIPLMQGWTATMRHGVRRKRNAKRLLILRHKGNLSRKNAQLKDVY